MLVPTLTALFPRWRMRPALALASLLGSALVGCGWLLAGRLSGGTYPFGIEPIYPALLTSALVFALDRATRAKETA